MALIMFAVTQMLKVLESLRHEQERILLEYRIPQGVDFPCRQPIPKSPPDVVLTGWHLRLLNKQSHSTC